MLLFIVLIVLQAFIVPRIVPEDLSRVSPQSVFGAVIGGRHASMVIAARSTTDI